MKKSVILILVVFFIYVFSACKKVERDNSLDGFATVETKKVSNLDAASVAIGAKIDRIDESVTVTQRGICYSVQKNPTIEDSIVINGNGIALGRSAMWWTTTEVYSYSARTLQLRDVDEIPQTFTENKASGLSVRCVMDKL